MINSLDFTGMVTLHSLIDNLGSLVPILRTVLTVIIIYILFSLVISYIKKSLLKHVTTKKSISNVEIFSKILKYVSLLILMIFAIFSYAGSWTGLGIGVGLFSAALGWALQKPITGIAGWIMVVTKRPFEIGDRVIIENVRGDVTDITLTHIYLKEVGGIVVGEETSGRIIMVPNSVLFEKNIINYTLQNEFVLDQVVPTVTYESNLDRAMGIALDAARKHTKEFIKKTKKEPYIRVFFQPSGISVHVRYFAPATRLQEISSIITKEIHNKIMKTKDIKIAYPHTEVVFKKDNTNLLF